MMVMFAAASWIYLLSNALAGDGVDSVVMAFLKICLGGFIDEEFHVCVCVCCVDGWGVAAHNRRQR